MKKKQTYELTTKEIGKLLKEARTAGGLTQQDIADQSGLSRHQIVNVETGISKGSIDLLLVYAKALEQSPDQILGLEGRSVIPELAEILKAASKPDQAKLVELYQTLCRLSSIDKS